MTFLCTTYLEKTGSNNNRRRTAKNRTIRDIFVSLFLFFYSKRWNIFLSRRYRIFAKCQSVTRFRLFLLAMPLIHLEVRTRFFIFYESSPLFFSDRSGPVSIKWSHGLPLSRAFAVKSYARSRGWDPYRMWRRGRAEERGIKTRERASRCYATYCLPLRPPNEIATENLTTLPLNTVHHYWSTTRIYSSRITWISMNFFFT